MSKERWKEAYYSPTNVLFAESSLFFISQVSPRTGGTGTRLLPLPSYSDKTFALLTDVGVFSGGVHKSGATFKNCGYVAGQGMNSTVLECTVNANYWVMNSTLTANCSATGNSNGFYNCKILDTANKIHGTSGFRNCLIYYKPLLEVAGHINNSFIEMIDNGSKIHYSSNLSIFQSCELTLSKADIETTYKNNFFAFQRCKFKIGAETTTTELTGTTADELRANFATRCTAQGITVPIFTEYGDTNLKMGRWIFSNNSLAEGAVITGSEVDKFQKARGIYFGYESNTVEALPISVAPNVKNSFTSKNPISKIVVADNSLSLVPTFSLFSQNAAFISSMPVYLGGRNKISQLIVANNLPQQYGVAIDGTNNIEVLNAVTVSASTTLKNNVNYVVRSQDGQPASFTYATVSYNSSLSLRNNILRGVVDGAHAITNIVGKPILVPVEDVAGQQTVKMRIVSAIPPDIINNGATLQADYWYMLEPNNPVTDLGATVTYNGIVYPVYAAFWTNGTPLTFNITGNAHLRRMWRESYTEASEVTDKDFWAAIQKPKWIDVVPNDMRCMMTNNSDSEIEMQRDSAGNYIASGHPDFYDNISGANGVRLPAFDINGVFVQYKLEINSLNPM